MATFIKKEPIIMKGYTTEEEANEGVKAYLADGCITAETQAETDGTWTVVADCSSDVKFHPNGATRFRSNGATLKRKFSGSDRVYYLPFLCCFSSCSFIGLGER